MIPVKGFPSKRLIGIPTKNYSRQQWINARTIAARDAIGGSEIGTLLKLDNRFNSTIRLFYQRLGLWPDNYQDNKYAFSGRLLEETIIGLWRHWAGDWESTMVAFENGQRSRKSQHSRYILKNQDYPTLLANIDSKIIFSPDSPIGGGILECKTISGHAADRFELRVPPKHIAQVQAYLLVTGYEYGEIAMLESGVEFFVYPIAANTTIQNKIVEVSEDFFKRVNSARKAMAGYDTFEEQVFAVQEYEPPVEDGDDEYQFLSEKAKRLSMDGDFEPDEQVKLWFEHAMDFADREKECAERKLYNQNQIRQEMTAKGRYRYSWPEGVITNGTRFSLKRRKPK